MNSIKEIEKVFEDELEPYYDNLDHIVEEIIRPKVSDNQFKFFEGCRFKLKSMWYILKRIEKLDNEYKNYLELCKAKNVLENLSFSKRKDWGEEYKLYFPFYEAVEFENLLTQGKACLDIFSKAIGSLYSPYGIPNNLKKLTSVLQSHSHEDERIHKLLQFIEHGHRLHGIIIDPIDNKKSLRDLVIHYEKADIFFTLRWDTETKEYIISPGAQVNMKHPELARLQNYLVAEIANKLWFLVLGIVEKCFSVQFEKSADN